MIAIDTNILARAIFNDDNVQSKQAQNFLIKTREKGQIFVSSFVLLEFIWLMTSKKIEKSKIIEIITSILDTDGFVIEKQQVFTFALNLYSKNNLGFADCVTVADGTLTAKAVTYTFDKDMIDKLNGLSPQNFR